VQRERVWFAARASAGNGAKVADGRVGDGVHGGTGHEGGVDAEKELPRPQRVWDEEDTAIVRPTKADVAQRVAVVRAEPPFHGIALELGGGDRQPQR